MKNYIEKISEEKQWDIIKMMLAYRDFTMLMRMFEDGYKVTPALLEALFRLHAEDELRYIILHYAEKFKLWHIAEELLGKEVVDELKDTARKNQEEYRKQESERQVKRFRELLARGVLTLELFQLADNDKSNSRYAAMFETFGQEELYNGAQRLRYSIQNLSRCLRNAGCPFSDDFLLSKEEYRVLLEYLPPQVFSPIISDQDPTFKKAVRLRNVLAAIPDGRRCIRDLYNEDADRWLLQNYGDARAMYKEACRFKSLSDCGCLDFDGWKTWYKYGSKRRRDMIIVNRSKTIINKPKGKLFAFLLFHGHFAAAFRAL